MGKGRITVERKIPTVEGLVPVWAVFLLSFGSGLTVFIGVGLLAWAFQFSVRYALAGAGAVVLVVWGVWVSLAYSLFWAVETVSELEPAGAEPVKAPPVVSVEVSQPETGRMRFLELPGGVDQVRQLAAGVLAGRTLAEAEWSGAGRPYSRSEFRALRAELIDRGLASWRNSRSPSQGVELTLVGRSVFRHIAEDTRARAHVRPGGGPALLDDGQQGRAESVKSVKGSGGGHGS